MKEDAPMVDPQVKNLEWDRWIAFHITSNIHVAGGLYLSAVEQYGDAVLENFSREKCHFLLGRGKSLPKMVPSQV